MRPRAKYDIGDIHNFWEIIDHAPMYRPKTNQAKAQVKVRCKCGHITTQILNFIQSGKSRMCRSCSKKKENWNYPKFEPQNKYGNAEWRSLGS